jgi:hypothetical protein
MRTVNPRFLQPTELLGGLPNGFRDVIETKITGSFLVARAVVPRMLAAGGGRIITISMSEQTMTRRGFAPYGPSGAGVEALSRVMAADLAGTSVTVNILLPWGATATGMIPEDESRSRRRSLIRRSWAHPSSGSPPTKPRASTTSASSPPTSTKWVPQRYLSSRAGAAHRHSCGVRIGFPPGDWAFLKFPGHGGRVAGGHRDIRQRGCGRRSAWTVPAACPLPPGEAGQWRWSSVPASVDRVDAQLSIPWW